MSTLKINTLSNVAGTQSTAVENAIQGSAKAWVNFNGTGTVAIRAQFNVSSITDNGTGDYTVNFTTSFSDANYSVCGLAKKDNTTTSATGNYNIISPNTYQTTSVRLLCMDGVGNAYDTIFTNIAIFR